MEFHTNRTTTFTITGVFGNNEDAENAYHTLMELGYNPDEITLIMSDETREKFYRNRTGFSDSTSSTDHPMVFNKDNWDVTISDAIDVYGKFIAMPGVSLMVAGDFNDGGIRALTSSVMSETYAEYFKTRIQDGEIVIDFQPHTVREKNMITGIWENNGGYPIIRRMGNHAA